MKIRAFITHKLAEKFSDCQDYFDINQQRHSVAVADGMSQSIFPQWWAKYLTEEYNKGSDIDERLSDLQKRWLERVNDRLKEKEEENSGSAWRLRDRIAFKQGAGSTICGIEFDGTKWSCFILGDTSIIQVNADYKIVEIHNSNRDGFGNHPDYYDSFNGRVGEISRGNGTLNNGEYILLVSDPLGEFLELKKASGDEALYVKRLIEISNHDEFGTSRSCGAYVKRTGIEC